MAAPTTRKRKFSNKTATFSFTRRDNPRFWKGVLGEANKQARLSYGVVGEAAKQKYPGGQTLAEVAAWNSFGTATIPARPFLTIDPVQVKAQLAWVSKQLFSGKGTAKEALGFVGRWAVEQARAKIDAHIPPQNADSTVARKGFDWPLVHTRKLYNALTWVVALGK